MCGIIGYIGKNKALPILIDGLKRLEYRGYDSSGVAVFGGNNIFCVKEVGKIKELENKIAMHFPDIFFYQDYQNLGIAHTRWATHGSPTEENAHPHSDCTGNIMIVHNGIIENYKELKEFLIKKGHIFKSETDSEVIAHLIEENYNRFVETADKSGNNFFFESVLATLKFIKGTYGVAVINKDEPNKLIAAKFGSPLLIGIGENETIVASDASAILKHTNKVIYLNDGEVACIENNNIEIYDLERKIIDKNIEELDLNFKQIEKEGYPHFMLKEIFAQPETVANSIRGRMIKEEGKVKLGGLDNCASRLRGIEKIIITSCGTANYAGLAGEYMLEEYAGVSAEVEYASEFRYRKPIFDKRTVLIAISQSGETADTLSSIYEAKEKDILTMGIVNAVGSTIARETDAGIYNHIGPEIAVASTKAFTSQLSILALMTIFLGRQREMSLIMGRRIVCELESLPDKIKKILRLDGEIKNIAERYKGYKNFAFLGRKYNYPIALEGALKLKEISYVHAEGFPSGELKHGPIAMISKDFPSVFIAPQDSVYEKNLSNMEEIKARGGRVIAIASEGDEEIKKIADDVIYIPKTLEMLTPILSVIPLQLFAYYMAVLNGRDVDKPRNLAKSVTVE